ncbi:hypothetical protein IMG5_099570 [Ichthyophthirius multifiliis]|uniref:Sec61beta family protein n=1 Tax=Ichthyophthirius multifiliis TaxID=5932 RepID=G0QS64_ICHMU|nr:hypothetical protein IMG5_099570 [Ichthyophthirius multifiliis]EGR31929.1 hypothetical protein IMG5_099570 [Ichthyophthirius multifiliis]|eukprot:XP_004035415.1 hypothetical protein IMG5_099570 [Ichthyophthirius multifiliis]
MSSNENLQAALKKRAQPKPATGKSSGGSKSSGPVNVGTSDVGLKVQPRSVLVISLVFMGIVILLHIFGKLRGTSSAAQGAETPQGAQEEDGL